MYISIKFLGLRRVFVLKSSTRTTEDLSVVQGRLEIPVQVTAEMDLTERNKAILEKYKQIVYSNCKEPGIDKRPFR